jgi:hypothetical protein
MSPDRWEVAKTIFGQAIELKGRARELYLREACAGDPALRREVDSLLKADSPDTVYHSPVAPRPVAAPKRRLGAWILVIIGIVVLAVIDWIAIRPTPDIDWEFVPGTAVRVSESIYLRVEAKHDGFLYLLSDDPEKDTMNALGTFPLKANTQNRIPGGAGFRFDQPGGVNVSCIWSRQKLPELERLAMLFNSRDMGRVADYEQRVRLRQLVANPPKSVLVRSVRLSAR